jgi:hypothetical protein
MQTLFDNAIPITIVALPIVVFFISRKLEMKRRLFLAFLAFGMPVAALLVWIGIVGDPPPDNSIAIYGEPGKGLDHQRSP